MSELKHLWFSNKSKDQGNGTRFYQKEDGQEVEVTIVSSAKDHNSLWDDIEYLGLGRWAREGQVSEEERNRRLGGGFRRP